MENTMAKRIWPAIREGYYIGKRLYQVLFVDGFVNDVEQLGECRYDPPQLVLKNGQSDKEMVSTILHECLHGIDFEEDIRLTEKQVLGLEKGILKFLIKNKFI